MAGLFVITLFVAAWLLFAIQPMVGRMLLPKLGGSPAVWNTCLVFFQGMLLLGYLYSHLMPKWLGVRRHALVHWVLLAGVFFTLPTVLRGGDPPAESPAGWLLVTLGLSVGLPFFALATTSPLLQKWYADRRGRDPYFLSVASNAGSLALLLAYPLLIEPRWDLGEQTDAWMRAYLGLVALAGLCVLMIWSKPAVTVAVPAPALPEETRIAGPAWRWVLLAFIPSSLLSGVTNSITTDVAPIPLLWVAPLALYLLTFIIAFAPIRLPMVFFGRLAVLGTIVLSLALLAGATEPLILVLAIHLGAFFSLAMLCHARLSLERPGAADLTRYYLLMSLGGALGGAFNALVAPLLFHRLGFVEYPLMIVVAGMVRPVEARHLSWKRTDLLAPAVLGAFVAGVLLLSRIPAIDASVKSFGEQITFPVEMLKNALCFGIPLVICYFFVDRPVRFSLGLGAVMLASSLHDGAQGRRLLIERNFLGVVKVTESPDGEFIKMVHGNTVHGQQRPTPRPRWLATYLLPLGANSATQAATTVAVLDDRWDDRQRPLTYYHASGPAGGVFRLLTPGWKDARRIGAVGLGTGALASYARASEAWTFFELDSAVERLARDERYFTYLKGSRAKSLNVVIGDARLKLADEPDGSFDVLALDAFSSDAIPLHLLTAEAFELYRRKLAPGGVILMHLSNRYLDLAPMVARIAGTLSPEMVARVNNDLGLTEREREDGKFPSIWVIVARREEDFGVLQRPVHGWSPIVPSPARAWTDNRSNLLDVLRTGPAED